MAKKVTQDKTTLSYEWDLLYDLKTEEEIKKEYQKTKEDIIYYTKKLKVMEELAKEDGIKLT